MHSTVLANFDPPVESENASMCTAIRSLVAMSRAGAEDNVDFVLDENAEVILVDLEVDGARYLLVRMPKLNKMRVQLSPREQEIGRMVAKGHPNKVIADVLNISSWTVCTHLRRIFAKLGVGSRAAMVAQLLELGVLASEHRYPSDSRS
ncbi:MAG TPA: helix-turn-helix transcriptional regulator [Terracidiphilus sp.]|jgi:DNA-binding CsgD family transcriptional regulator|nr:helix-turn-helix transcriptional regulator [Terracidiphilus sp.]